MPPPLFHNTQVGREHQCQLETKNVVLFSQNLYLNSYNLTLFRIMDIVFSGDNVFTVGITEFSC